MITGLRNFNFFKPELRGVILKDVGINQNVN